MNVNDSFKYNMKVDLLKRIRYGKHIALDKKE